MIFRKGLCYSQLRDAGLQIDDAMAEQIRFSREREAMANWTWTNTWSSASRCVMSKTRLAPL
jgi:hypothetical protein